MKKLFLALLGIAGASLAAQAQSDGIHYYLPPDTRPILVGGAAPVYAQPVYNQQVTYVTPVQYDAPVQYVAPVQYSAPVQYNAPVQYYAPVTYAPVVENGPVYYTPDPCEAEPVCFAPTDCVDYSYSTVQVIVFGQGQACQQGYSFGAGR